MNQTYFTVLIFSLSFLFGATIEDRCTKHSEPPYLILTECPSSEKFNLLECYDSEGKNNSNDVLQQFWCWNRKDNDEKVIKDVSISTARVEVDDLIANINQPFSSQFTFDGTYLKCDTIEKWSTDSIYVNTTEFATKTLPCVTNTLSVVEITYCNPMHWLCIDKNGL